MHNRRLVIWAQAIKKLPITDSYMARKQLTVSRLILLFMLGLTCIALSGLGWVVENIPRWAAEDFGRPSPALTYPQRLSYALRLYLNQADLTDPLDVGGEAQPFRVELGEPITSIAGRLEQAGLIRSAEAFRIYLLYSGLDTTLQAGDYQISPALNTLQIAGLMQDATPRQVDFRILPGWRLEEVAAALPTSGLAIDPQSFLDAVYNPEALSIPAQFQELDSLEGYLYPGSYRFAREAKQEEVIAAFVSEFEYQVGPGLIEAYRQQGLDLPQAVTLASIIQREAVIEEEQPLIASVLFNRLDTGMKLETDPTVQYARGYNLLQRTWWTNPLSWEDLRYDSPYNTYLYEGIPPGPICNPAISALRAVAQPAQTPYFYFRARCDGSGLHTFAVTYDEHLKNECP